MPVVGTPVVTPTPGAIISNEDLRIFLRDRPEPEYNTILDGIDFKDIEIEKAVEYVVDHYNTVPPRIARVAISNFPSKVMLLYGVAGHLLKGEAARQARNQVQYQEGDINLGINDKAPLFTQLAQILWGDFLQMEREFKVAKNMEEGFGSYSSMPLFVVDR
jgi:hypothetical protein